MYYAVNVLDLNNNLQFGHSEVLDGIFCRHLTHFGLDFVDVQFCKSHPGDICFIQIVLVIKDIKTVQMSGAERKCCS